MTAHEIAGFCSRSAMPRRGRKGRSAIHSAPVFVILGSCNTIAATACADRGRGSAIRPDRPAPTATPSAAGACSRQRCRCGREHVPHARTNGQGEDRDPHSLPRPARCSSVCGRCNHRRSPSRRSQVPCPESRVADIRTVPKSRRHPHFHGDALARSLRSARSRMCICRGSAGGGGGGRGVSEPRLAQSVVSRVRRLCDGPGVRGGAGRATRLSEERRTAMMCSEALCGGAATDG